MIIQSKCIDGCKTATKIDYKYRVYYKNETFPQTWELLDDSSIEYLTMGSKTAELTLFKSIFDTFNFVNFWRIYFDTTVYDSNANTVVGSTFINFQVNQKPFNGTCTIDSLNGFAFYTLFKIECLNWLDKDGYITRYEYFGKK